MNLKYCIRTHTVNKKWCSRNSQAWKLLMMQERKHNPTSFGESVKVNAVMWWDNWTERGALASMFPDDIINPRAKVKNYIVDSMWDLQRLRNMLPQHMV